MDREKKSILALTAIIASALFLPQMIIAGDLEPSATPGPTMKTLDQIPPTWSIKLPAADRFVVLADFNNEAVLDKETGLVWEISPSTGQYSRWTEALTRCIQLSVAGRKGWHLPTIHQLLSLIDTDMTQHQYALPDGHPFDLGCQDGCPYWSATSDASSTTEAWRMLFANGVAGPFPKDDPYRVLCVRGGQSHDGQ